MANQIDVRVIEKNFGDPCAMAQIQELYPDVKVTKLRRELKTQGWQSIVKHIDGRSTRLWGSTEKHEITSGLSTKTQSVDAVLVAMINAGYDQEQIKAIMEMRHDYNIANEFAPQTPLAEIHEAADAIYNQIMKLDPGGRIWAQTVWEKRYIKAATFVRIWDDSFPEIERTKSYFDAVNRKHKYAFKCERSFVTKLNSLGIDMGWTLRADFLFTYMPESLGQPGEYILSLIEEGVAPYYLEEWEQLVHEGELPNRELIPKDDRREFGLWKTGHKPARGPVGKWFMERYNAGLEEAKPEKGAYKPELYRFEAPATREHVAGNSETS